MTIQDISSKIFDVVTKETHRLPIESGSSSLDNRETQIAWGNISINDAIGRYENSNRFKGFASTTRGTYSKTLRKLQKSCEDDGILNLSGFSEKKSDEWVQELRKTGTPNGTIRAIKPAIASFRRWWKIQELTRVNPGNTRILNDNEIVHLIKNTNGLRDAALILIALKTGATLSEILSLSRENIDTSDPENPTIYFDKTRETSYRYVSVDKLTAEVISMYIDRYIHGKDGNLFSTSGKKKLSLEQAGEILLKYGTKIGIPNLDFTVLRKTFIYNFKGSEIKLKEILGISE